MYKSRRSMSETDSIASPNRGWTPYVDAGGSKGHLCAPLWA